MLSTREKTSDELFDEIVDANGNVICVKKREARSLLPAALDVSHAKEELTEKETTWPKLAEEALHGFAADVVRAIDPHTEADPVAVLLNFLVAFGNCIHSIAHARAQHDLHPARLFVVQVGETSKGRKGTAWSTPHHLFSLVDAEWTQNCIKSGLSSAEGLIYHVRDASVQNATRERKGAGS